jgi:hypothetical protein
MTRLGWMGELKRKSLAPPRTEDPRYPGQGALFHHGKECLALSGWMKKDGVSE